MEQLDQEWIEQNIDIIMKEFLIINPEFKKKTNSAMAAKSRHKKKMLEDMDSPTYRPYYYIAKRYPEIVKAKNRKITKFYNEAKENEKYIKMWKSKYDYAEKKIKEYCGEKSYEYQIAFGKDPIFALK
jgi:hypothetical protein